MSEEPESDTPEMEADKITPTDNDSLLVSDNTEMTPLMVANDFIIKLMCERDDARQLAETFRDAWKSDHRGAFFVGTTLPWEK